MLRNLLGLVALGFFVFLLGLLHFGGGVALAGLGMVVLVAAINVITIARLLF